jgi:hypothetical protein
LTNWLRVNSDIRGAAPVRVGTSVAILHRMNNPFDVSEHVSLQRLADFTNDVSDLTEVEWLHIQNCPKCQEAYAGLLCARPPESQPSGKILQFRPKNNR